MSELKAVKMGLSISEPESPVVIIIGLVEGVDDTPVLKIEARGFDETDAGALEVAELLEGMAEGIRSHLGVVSGADERAPKRPRFNPRPAGGQKA